MTALPPPTGHDPAGLPAREPAVTVASITTVAAAVLAVVVAVVDVPDDLQLALVGLIAAIAPLVVGVVVRGRVTPVDR